MPVRSLSSSVLKWPGEDQVKQALRSWADKSLQRPDVIKVGYFGSYARGNWGVGSDLDVLILVTEAAQPFAERSLEWKTDEMPVPVDVLVYTEEEWERPARERMKSEAIWIEH